MAFAVSLSVHVWSAAKAQQTAAEKRAAEAQLRLRQQLDPACFAQVHRSASVNLRCVTSARRDELSRLFLRLDGQAQEVAVSRAYVHRFRAM